MELNREVVSAVTRSGKARVPRTSTHTPVHEAVILSALWTELVAGMCKVEGCTFDQHGCELTITREHRALGEKPRALPRRHAQILERSLLDGARKSVAIDLKLCPSTVAEILKQGFTFMGLSCWPSRLPLWLVLAAHAQRVKELARASAQLVLDSQCLGRQTVSISRPDRELEALLTPAEYAVARLLVEGKSYAEMAVLRQTSSRTVANQLAAAFHRLGVSGRAELLCLLAQRETAAWRISTPGNRSALMPVEGTMGFLPIASWQGR